jgi:hypothetical protein
MFPSWLKTEVLAAQLKYHTVLKIEVQKHIKQQYGTNQRLQEYMYVAQEYHVNK